MAARRHRSLAKCAGGSALAQCDISAALNSSSNGQAITVSIISRYTLRSGIWLSPLVINIGGMDDAFAISGKYQA